ncbi:MAG: sodium:proline symporter [Ectothiorhodospiraceae bacterium]|nr:sodium:proline symporter [Ectothiorhodospiraceae bacterium]
MTDLPLGLVIASLVVIAGLSLAIAPRANTAEGFFGGRNAAGTPPGVLVLTMSQVTTWIFARSLLNAGILGYYFGIAGALAYTVYYGSFLTGWLVVDRLRFRHGVSSIQSFLHARFGFAGTACFNVLVSLRLLSEVFANLLVVGIVFGVAGSGAYTTAILAVALVTFLYSMHGGLRASLRTDLLQMSVLVLLLAALLITMVADVRFDPGAILTSSPEPGNPGWILLIVALLQVLSYPMHDPVMMDRGFLSDRETTRKSFFHAFWISALCILVFGVLGVFAGLHRSGEEELLETLQRLLGAPAMVALAIALVISAASTMDSTLSSAAKLAVVDMGLGRRTAATGRLVMSGFMTGGLLLVFLGSDDLFSAVAVSGNASLFLAPVIIFCVLGGRRVHRWSLLTAFVAAVGGATLYFLETSGYLNVLGQLPGVSHDYTKLLITSAGTLAAGMAAFALGLKRDQVHA